MLGRRSLRHGPSNPMNAIESTHLWQRTLGASSTDATEKRACEKLRAAFAEFRAQAIAIAKEISASVPQLTVHDETHIDALWELADIVLGDAYPLNPVEAFILGGAFLVHDLANGLAAYSGGESELTSLAGWRDAVAAAFKAKLKRAPKREELETPPAVVAEMARIEMLRKNHGRQAEQLLKRGWQHHAGGPQFFLINDPVLRGAFGEAMGKVAHSHWWEVSVLPEKLPHELGSPDFAPIAWRADLIKVACILRACDALHVDARRAPPFLRVIRQTHGDSDNHWKFQERLLKPFAKDGRVVFTSSRAFELENISAWWLCFDTMRMIDGELRKIDTLLADRNRPRLVVSSVAAIEQADRFADRVRTDGWTPVDVRVRVGDVPSLVAKLGGNELYGKDPTVPLRELVQNGADAVRARRILDGQPNDWGEVRVACGGDDTCDWIEVSDTGLGMTKAVLTGPLLDFGMTYWDSALMRDECPGLASSPFQATGRYGIGFFAVFMWGDRVQIRTRRTEDGRDATRVLEFATGLQGRPVLRYASTSEQLKDGGTVVRVWLKVRLRDCGGLLSAGAHHPEGTLRQVCLRIFPALDVTLKSQEPGSPDATTVVKARDWEQISGEELTKRVSGRAVKEAVNVRSLWKDGELVGRACLVVPRRSGGWHRIRGDGVVTVGGQVAVHLQHISGVLVGSSSVAARNRAIPLSDGRELADWASEQARLISEGRDSRNDDATLAECAAVVRFLGGNTGPLPIAFFRQKWLTASELEDLEGLPDELYILQDAALFMAQKEHPGFELSPLCIATSMGWPGVMQEAFHVSDWPQHRIGDLPPEWEFHNKSLCGLVIEALATRWRTPTCNVTAASVKSDDRRQYNRPVGEAANGQVLQSVHIIRRPGSPAALQDLTSDTSGEESDED